MGQGRAVNQGLKVGGHFIFYRKATLSVKKDVISYKYFLSIASSIFTKMNFWITFCCNQRKFLGNISKNLLPLFFKYRIYCYRLRSGMSCSTQAGCWNILLRDCGCGFFCGGSFWGGLDSVHCLMYTTKWWEMWAISLFFIYKNKSIICHSTVILKGNNNWFPVAGHCMRFQKSLDLLIKQ